MIHFIQPRHIYAPSPDVSPLGHVYLPVSLLTAAARFIAAGQEVRILDENIVPLAADMDCIAINSIGAPYIPAIVQLIDRVKKENPKVRVIVGGQGVRGLLSEQFSALFGSDVCNGNLDEDVSRFCGFDAKLLPAVENTSIIPALEKVDDEILKLYLSSEFTFYLSQGCRYDCEFCAAIRTRVDPESGSRLLVKEQYRCTDLAIRDLEYISRRAAAFGIRDLTLYLSNLDLLQTPQKLIEFFNQVELSESIRSSRATLRFRGLVTVASFLQFHKKYPADLKRICDRHVFRMGFGIDGASAEVWKKTRKPQNMNKCLEAIHLASSEYELEVEGLMVFGHNDADTQESLNDAVSLTKDLVAKYGMIPRPHVAKDLVPGNDGWYNPDNSAKVDFLITNPAAFQLLDFTALPSAFTHPNEEFRSWVERAFLEICSIPNSLTQYVHSIDPLASNEEQERARRFNLGRYDN